jgi:lysophospholipase L1-like esterase
MTAATVKKWLFRLAAIAVGILFAVLIAEFAVRVFFPPTTTIRYTIQRNSGYFSSNLIPDSPLFYTYSGFETDGRNFLKVHYPDNRLRKFSFRKPANTFRVVAVGDSLTEEWNLPGFVNYTDFLRAAITEELRRRKVHVLPLGVGGYNTWQEMNFFRDNWQRVQTDVLLLECCPNDADVMTLKKRNPNQPAPNNEWPEYELVGTRVGQPDFSRGGIDFLQSRLLWRLKDHSPASPSLNGGVQLPGNDQQRTAFIWFRDNSRERQIPFLVVLFPLFDDNNAQTELTYVKRLLDEIGVEYLDLLPELQKRGRLSALGRDLYHPNTAGHRYAAEAILRYLKRHGLLPAGVTQLPSPTSRKAPP